MTSSSGAEEFLIARAPIYPGAGAIVFKVQSHQELSFGIDSTHGGSSGKNVTSTRFSESAMPSPVAFRMASLRVQRLKNATGFNSFGNRAKRRDSREQKNRATNASK